MENIATSKKLVFIFLSVGIAAVLVVLATTLWYRNSLDRKTASNNEQQEIKQPEQVLKVEKKEIDKSKSPDKFPADIPIESGAKITQNYNATTPDGRFQATRVFESSKTLEENFKIYNDYMKQGGWKVSASINQDGYKMVSGSKSNLQLQVSISENTLLKTKNVSISLTELPVTETPSKK